MIKDKHLGGFVDGGDERCFYPEMWDTIIESFKAESVIDVGCGQGHALEYFKQKGLTILGVDGSPLVKENARVEGIQIHDYTKEAYIPKDVFDFAWSCEFVEHVEEMYIKNFMATFQKAKLVAISHAFPGQGGYHHVNEQKDDYWIKQFETYGFEYLPFATQKARALAHDYFKRSGLIFINDYFKE